MAYLWHNLGFLCQLKPFACVFVLSVQGNYGLLSSGHISSVYRLGLLLPLSLLGFSPYLQTNRSGVWEWVYVCVLGGVGGHFWCRFLICLSGEGWLDFIHGSYSSLLTLTVSQLLRKAPNGQSRPLPTAVLLPSSSPSPASLWCSFKGKKKKEGEKNGWRHHHLFASWHPVYNLTKGKKVEINKKINK